MAKASKPRFQYQKRTVSEVQERANASGGDFATIFKPQYKVYKIKDGKNVVRILPKTWEGDPNHYGYSVWINYGIGPDNQNFLSLSKMLKEKDPLAEARRIADKDGDEDTSKALNPRQRIVMWVIDREDEDAGPQVFSCPMSVDKDLASISVDEDTNEVVLVDEPEEGTDFRFHREGKGLKTKYPAAKMRLMKPSPIHADEGQQEEWLNYIQDNPIPETLNFYSYDHIAETFGGSVRTEKDDDKPSGRRSGRDKDEDEDAPPPRRGSRAAPADDEEEKPWEGRAKPAAKRAAREEVAEDDEEDAPPPRRGAGAAKRTAAPVDDVDDTPPPPRRSRTAIAPPPDEDEEVEDAPPPRRRAARAPDPDTADEDEVESPPPRRTSARRPEPADDDVDGDDDRESTRDVVKKGGLRDRLSQRRQAVGGKPR